MGYIAFYCTEQKQWIIQTGKGEYGNPIYRKATKHEIRFSRKQRRELEKELE